MIFTLGLLIYHSSLIWRNLTTKEELKNSFDNIYNNPYNRGLCGNIKKILFPKLNYQDIIDKIREKIYNKIRNNELKEKKEEKKEEKNELNFNKNLIENKKLYENIDKENEDKINSGEKISGINKTNPESEENNKNQKKREEIYFINENKDFQIEEKKDNYSNINKEYEINNPKDNEKEREISNSQIKIILLKEKINSNEKSIDFNLQQSMEINQEGIIYINKFILY